MRRIAKACAKHHNYFTFKAKCPKGKLGRACKRAKSYIILHKVCGPNKRCLRAKRCYRVKKALRFLRIKGRCNKRRAASKKPKCPKGRKGRKCRREKRRHMKHKKCHTEKCIRAKKCYVVRRFLRILRRKSARNIKKHHRKLRLFRSCKKINRAHNCPKGPTGLRCRMQRFESIRKLKCAKGDRKCFRTKKCFFIKRLVQIQRIVRRCNRKYRVPKSFNPKGVHKRFHPHKFYSGN